MMLQTKCAPVEDNDQLIDLFVFEEGRYHDGNSEIDAVRCYYLDGPQLKTALALPGNKMVAFYRAPKDKTDLMLGLIQLVIMLFNGNRKTF